MKGKRDSKTVYDEICQTLLTKIDYDEFVYGVPGHPLVAEKTVQLLLEKGHEAGVKVEVRGGQSFLDDIFGALSNRSDRRLSIT